jgi:menaquinone-dependent protoporphyrinogen oxidase
MAELPRRKGSTALHSAAPSVNYRAMNDSKSILVAYASARGSTAEVAGFIAGRLRSQGFGVVVCTVDDEPDPHDYDAVVIGSAVHNMAWLPEAESYLRRHRAVLAERDVWLFSVGLSPALHGPIGSMMRRAVPKRIAALLRVVPIRDYAVFAGVYGREGRTLTTRIIYRLIGGGSYGDLRDWTAITRWADASGDRVLAKGEGPTRR